MGPLRRAVRSEGSQLRRASAARWISDRRLAANERERLSARQGVCASRTMRRTEKCRLGDLRGRLLRSGIREWPPIADCCRRRSAARARAVRSHRLCASAEHRQAAHGRPRPKASVQVRAHRTVKGRPLPTLLPLRAAQGRQRIQCDNGQCQNRPRCPPSDLRPPAVAVRRTCSGTDRKQPRLRRVARFLARGRP